MSKTKPPTGIKKSLPLRLRLGSQRWVQAAAGHDVRLGAEDAGAGVFDIHQGEQVEEAELVVEEEINIGVWTGFAALSGAK